MSVSFPTCFQTASVREPRLGKVRLCTEEKKSCCQLACSARIFSNLFKIIIELFPSWDPERVSEEGLHFFMSDLVSKNKEEVY